jgi:two-component system sensor histidine kinase HydH
LSVRVFAHAITIVVSVAGVLALSAAHLQKERGRLLDEFQVATVDSAREARHTLSGRLTALTQDTELLVNLVDRTRRDRGLDRNTQNRVILSAFDALVAVVVPYRTVMLFAPDGSFSVEAVDPTEDRSRTEEALIAASRALAVTRAPLPSPAMSGPVSIAGDRHFYLYAAGVPGGETIVLTLDAVMFFATALPAPVGSSRLIVADPEGQAWLGCPDPARCRSTPARALLAGVPAATAGAAVGHWLPPALADRFGIGRAPGLLVSGAADTRTGRWQLWLAVSARAIIERQDSLLRWLIVTSLAAALSVVAVGIFILRQQRRAVSLEERLLAAEELAAIRERSDRIIESAPIGVLGVTGDGRVAMVNPFLERKLGPVTVGAPLREAFSGEVAAGAQWLDRALAPPPTGLGDVVQLRDVPLCAPRPGEFDLHLVPLNRGGDDIRAFALIEDRSEVRNLERQLIRAEKLSTVGVLSAGIAHEIGTPLAVIRGRTEYVARQLGARPDLDQDVAAIVGQIDGISSTIRQLLDFSRTTTIERRPVTLAVVTARCRQLLDWRLDARQLTLQLSVDPALPPLAADEDQLQQVLVNVLMNACDACGPGGVVRLVAAPAGPDRLRIVCVDDGCGVAREHLNAVFDPFFTTKKRGEGTGLGLSIVASIVRNHGGDVRLASVPGRGTTVTILWPTLTSPEGTSR